jgi:hypothetical protein
MLPPKRRAPALATRAARECCSIVTANGFPHSPRIFGKRSAHRSRPIASEGRPHDRAARDVLHAVAIYNGPEFLGDVAELGNGQFRATDRNEIVLGIFDDRRQAEAAILLSRIGRVST